MSIDEKARQEYLNVIGVDLWYCKAILPGAKTSGSFRFDDGTDEITQHGPVLIGANQTSVNAAENLASTQQPPEAESRGICRVDSILSQPPVKPELLQKKVFAEPPRKPSQGAVAKGLGHVFLLVFRVGDLVFVSDANELHLPMLKKLVWSISESIVKLRPSWEVGELIEFEWPVFSHQDLPFQTDADAARIFERCVKRVVTSSECTLIVMGDAAFSALTVLSRFLQESKLPILTALTSKEQIIRAASLIDALAEPLLKRTLWQQLSRVLATG